MEPLNHDGAAVLTNSQDVRDALAANMTGGWRRSLGAAPQAPEQFKPSCHRNSMNKIGLVCNHPYCLPCSARKFPSLGGSKQY
jgi:hypothetical protein